MRLKTALLLALTCVLTFGAYAQNQNPSNYGNITATASDCTVTPAACVSLHFPYSNTGVVGIQVTGTWTATLVSQGSSDNGANWFTVNMTPYTSSTPISSTAANGNWQAFVGGLTDFRIRSSAYTSGTAAVVITSTSAVGAGAVEVPGSVTSGTASAVTQPGTPIMCDTATSGTVTAGQAQMVRCSTGGVITTLSNTVGIQANESVSDITGFLASNSSGLLPKVTNKIYNGVGMDHQLSASLANFPTAATLTARNSIGAVLVEKGSRFSVFSNPAAGSQATASIAAEASVRHVADCVSFSGGSVVAPALTALTVNLRDGATGAGTVIWTQQIVISAATGQNVAPFTACGLNLVGTTNTAMTLEFSAALASLSESATITGFNVN